VAVEYPIHLTSYQSQFVNKRTTQLCKE